MSTLDDIDALFTRMGDQARLPAKWHNSREARTILSRIRPADLYIARVTSIPGPDRLAYACDAREKLDACRTRWIEQMRGTFLEAEARGEVRAYLAWIDEFGGPSAEAVLCERFGSPNQWLSYGAAHAQEMIRARLAERLELAA